MKSLSKSARELVAETWTICRRLFAIMIPVIVVVKILQELGLVTRLGALLEPVMRCVGLPGSMGLAWATAMMTSLYGGMTSYLAIAGDNPLTVAQVTILSSMMLIAHGLPVEVGIASKAGARGGTIALLRIGGALSLGAILNMVFSAVGGRFAQPAVAVITPPAEAAGLWEWTVGQLSSLGKIFIIVLLLVVVLKVLKKIRVTDLIERGLKPVLAPIGIEKEAAGVTTIGMVLGLSYGGGLIIDEVEKGHVRPKDVFLSLALMSLCHSLIEDTLLMASLGATLWGLLIGRIVFTFAIMIGIGFVVGRLSPRAFKAICFPKDIPPVAERVQESVKD